MTLPSNKRSGQTSPYATPRFAHCAIASPSVAPTFTPRSRKTLSPGRSSPHRYTRTLDSKRHLLCSTKPRLKGVELRACLGHPPSRGAGPGGPGSSRSTGWVGAEADDSRVETGSDFDAEVDSPGAGPPSPRAGRRTTTQFLAGTGAGALASTLGGAAGLTPPRRCFLGGMRRTRTGGGSRGASVGRAGGGTSAARITAAGAGRTRRWRAGFCSRRCTAGEVGGSPSAARTISSATFRTSPTSSATNASTVASICVSMLIVSDREEARKSGEGGGGRPA